MLLNKLNVLKAGIPIRGEGGTGLNGSPSGLTAAAYSSTQINLLWTIGSTNHTGHKIYRSDDEGVTYSEIATVLGLTNIYEDTGLTENTTYYYMVRAYK
jgi:hypothetical protein